MSGYSDVIQVIGAMIIFSMILLNANSLMLRNQQVQVESELEQEVVALAQEIIEEARTRSFDQVTWQAEAPPSEIPEGFSAASALGPDSGEGDRTQFNDFDDYNGWSQQVETEQGIYDLDVLVEYVDNNQYQSTTSPSTFKKMTVRITHPLLRDGSGSPRLYRLEFIRNYYAD
ncbi:MAG: type IV pilus modification PilV family protein [Bacteroidota bacterium]